MWSGGTNQSERQKQYPKLRVLYGHKSREIVHAKCKIIICHDFSTSIGRFKIDGPQFIA